MSASLLSQDTNPRGGAVVNTNCRILGQNRLGVNLQALWQTYANQKTEDEGFSSPAKANTPLC